MTMDTILLTGKTGFFSKEALQYIGETAQVFVTGSRPGTETKGLPESVRLLPAAPSDDDFRGLSGMSPDMLTADVLRRMKTGRTGSRSYAVITASPV